MSDLAESIAYSQVNLMKLNSALVFNPDNLSALRERSRLEGHIALLDLMTDIEQLAMPEPIEEIDLSVN